jgi:hypothetical protein
VRRPLDIARGAGVNRAVQPAQNGWAGKTYNYLRLGMLVLVAALGYSILEEARRSGVHCYLGSISGYYYTPVQPVFIGVMVAVGFALIVIKGRTGWEDIALSLAGMMAPLVAFVPTTDDSANKGVCIQAMETARRYRPDPMGSVFVHASSNNNLHAVVFAGYVALGLAAIAPIYRWLRPPTPPKKKYGESFWISWIFGLVVVVVASILLATWWDTLRQGHAIFACLMFGFLATAALVNAGFGLIGDDEQRHTLKRFALSYLVVGLLMIASGVIFLIWHAQATNPPKHLVLGIEGVEIFFFACFWAIQTVERWDQTV